MEVYVHLLCLVGAAIWLAGFATTGKATAWQPLGPGSWSKHHASRRLQQSSELPPLSPSRENTFTGQPAANNFSGNVELVVAPSNVTLYSSERGPEPEDLQGGDEITTESNSFLNAALASMAYNAPTFITRRIELAKNSGPGYYNIRMRSDGQDVAVPVDQQFYIEGSFAGAPPGPYHGNARVISTNRTGIWSALIEKAAAKVMDVDPMYYLPREVFVDLPGFGPVVSPKEGPFGYDVLNLAQAPTILETLDLVDEVPLRQLSDANLLETLSSFAPGRGAGVFALLETERYPLSFAFRETEDDERRLEFDNGQACILGSVNNVIASTCNTTENRSIDTLYGEFGYAIYGFNASARTLTIRGSDHTPIGPDSFFNANLGPPFEVPFALARNLNVTLFMLTQSLANAREPAEAPTPASDIGMLSPGKPNTNAESPVDGLAPAPASKAYVTRSAPAFLLLGVLGVTFLQW